MGALMRRVVAVTVTLLTLLLLSWPALAAPRTSRLDSALASRAGRPGVSRVIVRGSGTGDVTLRVRALRGRAGQRLALVNGYVAEVPNESLALLAADPSVAGVHLDRPVGALVAPGESGAAASRDTKRRAFEFTGAGVGVAVIDSGLTAWHDDLARVDSGRALVGQRVAGFVDFTGTTDRVADQVRTRHACRRHRRRLGV